MALSASYAQVLFENAVEVRHPVVKASATLYGGTLACNDSGVARPYTGALAAAGATLLGFPINTIVETTGSDYTPPTPIVYRRGCPFYCQAKSGDAPGVSQIGGFVALYDNFTAQTTLTSGYVQAILIEVKANGDLVVRLP